MTVFQLKRTNTADKRPDPALLLSGELALNYDAATGGVYYTNDLGNLAKLGPAQVSATAPNANPAGSAGNALGEFWYNTTNSELNMWNGVGWTVVSTPPVGFFANGGRLLESIAATTATTATLINFTSSQISDLATLGYANGIFTNTTTETRTYTFDLAVNISASTASTTPFSIWFQKNSTSSFSAANVYGLNTHAWSNNQGTTPENVSERTSWTFTLAPNDTITCWSSFPSEVTQFGGAGIDTAAGDGTRVNVTEIVTLTTTAQSTGFAEYTAVSATVLGDTKLDWTAGTVSSDFPLTYNSGTKSFVNNSTSSYTCTFDVTSAASSASAFAEWDVWFSKNNTGATPSSTSRYGQQAALDPRQQAPSVYQVNRTASYTLTLDAGESVQVWNYCSSSVNSNPAFQTAAGNFTAGQVSKLRITNIQATSSQQYGGQYVARTPATTTFGGNFLINSWSTVDSNTITTLGYAGGTFTNTSNTTRTYKISCGITLSGSYTNEPFYSWLQWNSNPVSSTNRLAYLNTSTSNAIPSYTTSLTQTLTLDPGGFFNIWVYTASNATFGGAGYGMADGYSNRISIQDITAESNGYGTIIGVTAGTGLSGGGYNGVVTLDLTPATSSIIGGVKPGSNVSIAVDGTLSVTVAGSSTQVLFNNAGALSGDADLTYNSTTNTLSVPTVDGATVDCGSY
jgi:hypothetical protein